MKNYKITQPTLYTEHRIHSAESEYTNNYSCYTNDDPLNCKLGYLKNLSQVFKFTPTKNGKIITDPKTLKLIEAETIEFINEVLKSLRRYIFISAIRKKELDMLKKHFALLYVMKVPIGYSGGFQWHILLENPHKKQEYSERIAKEKVVRVRTKKYQV